MQLRGLSNKKKSAQTTQLLEKEAKIMVILDSSYKEGQLIALKQILQQEKVKRESDKPIETTSNSRWKAASQNKSIRNYAQNVIQQKKELLLKKNVPPQKQQQERRPTSSKLQPIIKAIDKEIENFLSQLGLQQYKDKFGTFTMQSLKSKMQINQRDNITVQSLREMGVLPGHQIKIMRAIKDLNEDQIEDSFYQSRVSLSQQSQYQQSDTYESKQACWLCYKIYISDEIQVDGRRFCSKECQDQFMDEYMMNCKKCNKQFYKNDGCIAYDAYDAYYCSQVCSLDVQNEIRVISSNTVESEEEQQNNYAQEFNEFLTASLLQQNE